MATRGSTLSEAQRDGRTAMDVDQEPSIYSFFVTDLLFFVNPSPPPQPKAIYLRCAIYYSQSYHLISVYQDLTSEIEPDKQYFAYGGMSTAYGN